MRRGLQPRSPGSGRAALLALDLITDFEFPDGSAVRRALARHAPAIRRLLDAAHAHRVPVIYANDNLGAWRSDAPALIRHCTRTPLAGAPLVRRLAPAAEDEIILKPRHSAFYGTALEPLLDDRKIDTLLLVGISAESCVWMTACDAHTRGFRLVIPADTMAGAAARAVRATLTGLRQVLGARVPVRAASLRFGTGKLRHAPP
ncbi:MAG TPA: isochorismatase family cysteine hydrolase [Steroidobacteraceae bacterium]|jgi:nicotinamidase-related amidase|nr:isochorismatase family cysteine hydrolase [Steroidobacteraceae bacterium]